MKINYVAPFFDSSGYAQFSRNFVEGLIKQEEIDLVLSPVSFESKKSNLGKIQDELVRLSEKNKTGADINLINLTPEQFDQHMLPGAKNIGFTMFETTRIPDLWVEACNKMNGIIVPCEWNKEVFQSSGVTVPIAVAVPGMSFEKEIRVLEELDMFKGKYKFYSIFQWTERKNPSGLLKAYWSAFAKRPEAEVVLVLKTYGSNTGLLEKQRLQKTILRLKQDLKLDYYAPVYLIADLLSTPEIQGLHHSCDCFFLPHRAEGLGMPHLEAMSVGNPVVTTGFSGNTEFTKPDNSYLLDYQLTNVSGMDWIRWYEGDMYWAEPDLHQAAGVLRQVYDNQEEAKQIGKDGQEFVFQNFTLNKGAENLIAALKELIDD